MQNSSDVSYPGPPWRITGPSATVLRLVDVDVARKFVPDDLAIVPVRPGRTLAAVVVAKYGQGSTLQYSELSVMPALVRYRRRIGAWISWIWVDDPASLRGGREMWGVPKEMASFEWGADVDTGRARVHVADAESQPLASLAWREPQRTWPIPGVLSSLGSVNGDRRAFSGGGLSHMAKAQVSVDVPDDAPFSELWSASDPLTALVGTISLRFGAIRLLAPPA